MWRDIPYPHSKYSDSFEDSHNSHGKILDTKVSIMDPARWGGGGGGCVLPAVMTIRQVVEMS